MIQTGDQADNLLLLLAEFEALMDEGEQPGGDAWREIMEGLTSVQCFVNAANARRYREFRQPDPALHELAVVLTRLLARFTEET